MEHLSKLAMLIFFQTDGIQEFSQVARREISFSLKTLNFARINDRGDFGLKVSRVLLPQLFMLENANRGLGSRHISAIQMTLSILALIVLRKLKSIKNH
jgi:hypothetical protein